MRGTCSNGYQLRASGEMAQVVPVSYAEVSAKTMLPVSHLVWSALWLGIATDAVARARGLCAGAGAQEGRRAARAPRGSPKRRASCSS